MGINQKLRSVLTLECSEHCRIDNSDRGTEPCDHFAGAPVVMVSRKHTTWSRWRRLWSSRVSRRWSTTSSPSVVAASAVFANAAVATVGIAVAFREEGNAKSETNIHQEMRLKVH